MCGLYFWANAQKRPKKMIKKIWNQQGWWIFGDKWKGGGMVAKQVTPNIRYGTALIKQLSFFILIILASCRIKLFRYMPKMSWRTPVVRSMCLVCLPVHLSMSATHTFAVWRIKMCLHWAQPMKKFARKYGNDWNRLRCLILKFGSIAISGESQGERGKCQNKNNETMAFIRCVPLAAAVQIDNIIGSNASHAKEWHT